MPVAIRLHTRLDGHNDFQISGPCCPWASEVLPFSLAPEFWRWYDRRSFRDALYGNAINVWSLQWTQDIDFCKVGWCSVDGIRCHLQAHNSSTAKKGPRLLSTNKMQEKGRGCNFMPDNELRTKKRNLLSELRSFKIEETDWMKNTGANCNCGQFEMIGNKNCLEVGTQSKANLKILLC